MKRNEICCDICGAVVASKADIWFSRYDIIKPFAKVPCHYEGIDCSDGHIPSKTTKHICESCMRKLNDLFTKKDLKK